MAATIEGPVGYAEGTSLHPGIAYIASECALSAAPYEDVVLVISVGFVPLRGIFGVWRDVNGRSGLSPTPGGKSLA